MTKVEKAKRLVSREAAIEIAHNCEDAYSYESYTAAGWKQCAIMLAEHGFSKSQIVEVLRSKFTRWAGDYSSNRYGRYTSGDLKWFMDQKGWTPQKLQAAIDGDQW